MSDMVFVTLLCCRLLRQILTTVVSSMVLGCVSMSGCSLCCCMLFLSYVWVLFVVLM